MQQVVFFSVDFEKESSAFQNQGQLGKPDSPYKPAGVNLLAPYVRRQEILERYKGIELGLPEEWFHFDDRIAVNILEKTIPVEGDLKMLLYMPKGGTPLKFIVNDDYTENPVLTLYFITNINYGDQEAVRNFEQQCDEKLLQFQGNVQLL